MFTCWVQLRGCAPIPCTAFLFPVAVGQHQAYDAVTEPTLRNGIPIDRRNIYNLINMENQETMETFISCTKVQGQSVLHPHQGNLQEITKL